MNPHLLPWSISAEDFPNDEFTSDRLEGLLAYAILAPSPHNSQPWLFRINVNDVELFADRRRLLHIVDPHARELTLACGAALYNLRVAAEYFGQGYSVELLPDPAQRDLLARFTLHLHAETSSEDVVLFHALPQRRTNREPFRPDPIPDEILQELAEAAAAEAAWLHVATADPEKQAIAELVAQADRIQWANRDFRAELARWLRPDAGHNADGIPTRELGVHDWLAFAGPSLVRTFNRGNSQAAHDAEIATNSPALAVLGTAEDEPAAWLRAGQALQRVLLHAQSEGVSVSYLSQPAEVESLRGQLAELIGRPGHPQTVLRLGYGPEVPPTPRRSVRTLLIQHDTSKAPPH